MRRDLALVVGAGVLALGLLAASLVVYAWPDTPSPASAPAPIGSADLATQGRALVLAKGCGGCHTIPGLPGATGQVGPNLRGVATRDHIAGGAVPNNGPDDLQRWLLDPPALKPGTAMPKLGLTDNEAASIAAYLETLQ